MKIHFTCSTADFEKYKKDYFYIRELLIKQGHLLTRDWLPHTNKRIKSGVKSINDIKEIYQDNIRAIKEADLVIVEDTVSNFSTGHQITLSIQQKKPTLVLWQGRKHRKFEQMFIHGIDSKILQVTEYKRDELSNIIVSFINKFERVNETNRFHLVLTGDERQYLDWAQFNKGKSRTKLIKEALAKFISDDKYYSQYLRGE
ncbi:MAG: hypothetical protein ACOZAO_05020 [Patescibacteria group bacterium]